MASDLQKNLHNVDSIKELDELLSSGANINEKNDFEETPLLTALRRGVDLEVILYFIKCGADVNAKDCWSVSPLYCAVARHGKNLPLIQLLLDHGADIEGGKRINDRFLDHTVTHNLLCIKLLIKYKFLRNALLLLDLSLRRPIEAQRNYYEEYKSVVELDLKPSSYVYMRDFLDSCAAEVVRLQSVRVCGSVTMYHFVTANLLPDVPPICDVQEVLDGVFAEIWENDYPVYSDIIISKIETGHLFSKICDQFSHHAPLGKNFPYHVVIDHILKYLNKCDLLDFAKALN